MVRIRKSSERGYFNHGWLETYYTFSFANYYDPQWNNFKNLRVINQDLMAPLQGFSSHSHKNMEIITLVVSGALEHQDSAGHHFIIKANEVQRMTAGMGITHSEMNPSTQTRTSLFQIWLQPSDTNLNPSYEQQSLSSFNRVDAICKIASPKGQGQGLQLNADASIFLVSLNKDESFLYNPLPQRATWIQLINGNLSINSIPFKEGDGAGIENETKLELTAFSNASALIFDLKN